MLANCHAATITISNIGLAFNAASEPTVLDRLKYFNIHSSPGSAVEWPLKDATLFQSSYNSHLGRAFDVSYAMSQAHSDPARNNLVDIGKLQAWCQGLSQFGAWNESNVDMIISSKVTVTSLPTIHALAPSSSSADPICIGGGVLPWHGGWVHPRIACRVS